MKTIIKLFTLMLTSILFLNAEAQNLSSDKSGIKRSNIKQMSKNNKATKSKEKGSKDEEENVNETENQRMVYDAFGNAVWIPNSENYGYGNGYNGGSSSPGSYYGNSGTGYSYCGTSSNSYSPYNSINSFGNTGWYTPFTSTYGWNNFQNGFPTFYDEFNQPFDWNVTRGDYGLEIPREGVWIDKVYGSSTQVRGNSGQRFYLHEDGFFYRNWTGRDHPAKWGQHQVMRAPIGGRVNKLPQIARKVYAQGREYYIANNIVFQRSHHSTYQIVGVLT